MKHVKVYTREIESVYWQQRKIENDARATQDSVLEQMYADTCGWGINGEYIKTVHVIN